MSALDSQDRYISIHAPREGGDSNFLMIATTCHLFQSTPPARGATTITGFNVWYTYISIHAPREGGDSRLDSKALKADQPISIHAPREGGDYA